MKHYVHGEICKVARPPGFVRILLQVPYKFHI